jgi:endonuclease/exonuclease/phosphatase family metal-dependent hydrolase
MVDEWLSKRCRISSSDDDEHRAMDGLEFQSQHGLQQHGQQQQQQPQRTLNVVSWNVAELRRSSAAPPHWTPMNSFELLERELHGADIVCLQEWPDANMEVFLNEWRVGQPVPSHCGFTVPLFRKTAFVSITVHRMDGMAGFSAATAVTPEGFAVRVVSVHNLPFKQNADKRLHQMAQLTKFLDALSPAPTIIAGDFNMRKPEDRRTLDLGLIDCFDLSKNKDETCNTWDSFLNRYHAGGFEFKCRFDRIYFKNYDNARSAVFTDGDMHLVGSGQASPAKGHYLSDHFGLRQALALVPLA